MSKPYQLRFSQDIEASARDLADRNDIAAGLRDLEPPRPVLVLVGGADSLEERVARRIRSLFEQSLAPLLDGRNAAVIDGGTDSGIMALIGRARVKARSRFPLIGVAARGTVRLPGEPPAVTGRRPILEPNHTHFLLVPGDRWGDESPRIDAAARALAQGAPSATLAVGGGAVTKRDLATGLQAGRPTLLLAGSGGTTDDFVQALAANDLRRLGLGGVEAGLLRACNLDGATAILARLLAVPGCERH